jgi:heat shock protein HslJ
MRWFRLLFAAAAALALSEACVAQESEDGPLAAHWVATELDGAAVAGLTLDAAADKVSGSGGCNTFMGPISIEDDAIEIGPLAATKKMCEGKSELEAKYLAALEAARSFSVQGGRLTLKGEDGRVLVTFKK